MKTKLKTILVAVFIFLGIFLVLQFFLPDKYLNRVFNQLGTLRIESKPQTSVFVDSALIGQTPLQVNLSVGTHEIKLVPESADTELLPWSDQVVINQDTTTYVNQELATKDLLSSGEILSLEKATKGKGQILVSTDPTGLFVSLDGEDRGLSTLFMDNVSAGEHELAIRGEGFLPRSIKINVEEDYKLKAHFKLAVDEEYQEKKKESKEKKKDDKSETSKTLIVLETPTGWLRVRSEPDLNASESGRVNPGEEFIFFQEENNWYEIEYESEKKGWIYGEYVKIQENKSAETEESITEN